MNETEWTGCVHCGQSLPHEGTSWREAYRCRLFQRIAEQAWDQALIAVADERGSFGMETRNPYRSTPPTPASSVTPDEREAMHDEVWAIARRFNPSDPRYIDAVLASDWFAARVAAARAEALQEVREGLTRGMRLHHDGEHWVSLPDLLDRAVVSREPGEGDKS